jgi:hypothetical protein
MKTLDQLGQGPLFLLVPNYPHPFGAIRRMSGDEVHAFADQETESLRIP